MMDEVNDPEIVETAVFLHTAANALSTTCPAASRYYMSTLNRHIGNQLLSRSFAKPHSYCKYCGSLFKHLNHKVRIQPIPSPNRHIKKLIKWEKEQPWKLNNQQKKKLKKYRNSTNKIIYTCNICKKRTPFVGLKKYSAKEQDVPINTSTPKIKLKKGDLNAGLFIKTPIEEKIQNKLVVNNQDVKSQNEVPSEVSTSELMDTFNPNNGSSITRKTQFTSEIMKKNVKPQMSSSKKKKKKGLLVQILNQEQEARRQKKTLSSFLTSL
ncbi:UPF0711 protein C18orf21 homolog [Argiope bruennichi]|uniref:UPF0711 protein C18orf21 homolog n=1 Tax=Argiope bruennichi TaxID=94029 RepID=UPI00249535E2|nr:UPF0711 protein C18orf21 homolog [Argiope bruennichi]